jgi:hypothetical protein
MDRLLGRITTLEQQVQSLTQHVLSTPYAGRFTPPALSA